MGSGVSGAPTPDRRGRRHRGGRRGSPVRGASTRSQRHLSSHRRRGAGHRRGLSSARRDPTGNRTGGSAGAGAHSSGDRVAPRSAVQIVDGGSTLGRPTTPDAPQRHRVVLPAARCTRAAGARTAVHLRRRFRPGRGASSGCVGERRSPRRTRPPGAARRQVIGRRGATWSDDQVSPARDRTRVRLGAPRRPRREGRGVASARAVLRRVRPGLRSRAARNRRDPMAGTNREGSGQSPCSPVLGHRGGSRRTGTPAGGGPIGAWRSPYSLRTLARGRGPDGRRPRVGAGGSGCRLLCRQPAGQARSGLAAGGRSPATKRRVGPVPRRAVGALPGRQWLLYRCRYPGGLL